jgi:hypothetical protein
VKVKYLDINLIGKVKKSEEKIFRWGYYTGLSAILRGVPSGDKISLQNIRVYLI